MFISKKYLVALLICVSFAGRMQADAADEKFSKLSEACDYYSNNSCGWGKNSPGCHNAQQTINECRLSQAEYAERTAAFHAAADSYLKNCRGYENKSENRSVLQTIKELVIGNDDAKCEKSLRAIQEFLKYAKVHCSPDTLKKRIEVENALYHDNTMAEKDIGAFEKKVLTKCFGYHEDSYAQTEFSYQKSPECDQWIKRAREEFSSIDPYIILQYSRIKEKEKHDAKRARLASLRTHLSLPEDYVLHKQAVHALESDLDLYKEMLAAEKGAGVIAYRDIDLNGGWHAYPGRFKAFVQEEKLTPEDSKVIAALTDITHYWVKKGAIVAEPSYEDYWRSQWSHGAFKGVDGFSVAYALLRKETLDKAVHQVNRGYPRLSPAQEAAVVEALLIQCGDRSKRKIHFYRRMQGDKPAGNCEKLIHIHSFYNLLKQHEVV